MLKPVITTEISRINSIITLLHENPNVEEIIQQLKYEIDKLEKQLKSSISYSDVLINSFKTGWIKREKYINTKLTIEQLLFEVNEYLDKMLD